MIDARKRLRMPSWAVAAALGIAAPLQADAPQPVGTSTISVTYDTLSGPVTYTGARDYSGVSILDAVNLGGAPNIGAFSSQDSLGRRNVVADLSNPAVQAPNETLLTHRFYKVDTNDVPNGGDAFFPQVDPDGDVTIDVEGIRFDRPVSVVENTFLLHALWDIDQVDLLGPGRAYNSPHNHHIPAGFRDFGAFFGPGLPFVDTPPNYATFDGIAPVFTQPQPDTIDLRLTFPYELLRHLEDDGLGVPAGLPGPGGFLEPFHVHMEYLVTPEPSSAMLLLCAASLVLHTFTRPRARVSMRSISPAERGGGSAAL